MKKYGIFYCSSPGIMENSILSIDLRLNIMKGATLPLSMAASIHRLLSGYSFSLLDPFLCALLSHLELAWIKLVDIGVFVAMIFR